jgi:hypothetical protein
VRRGAAEVVTLDTLIAEHGLPRFCKIDVEGYEEQVLAGLNTAIPMLSLEFQPERLEAAQGCVERLQTLGRYEFNLGLDEHEALALPRWVDPAGLRTELERLRGTLTFGDIYARLIS